MVTSHHAEASEAAPAVRRARVGIQIGATTAPADLPDVVRQAERLGYGEIWLAEDYFQLGGIASAATALAATERIPIGLGVVAAAVRHPAVTAMEFATLGAIYPDRFMAGLGHGAAHWMGQMGLEPSSPLGLLRETTDSIRRLVRGDEHTLGGDYFNFKQVRLHHPPSQQTPLYLGVHGPASLRLSGELGDGTLLGWFSSPSYVSWARQRIDEGRVRAGREDAHELVALCLLSMSEEDPATTRRDFGRWVAPMLVGMARSSQLKESEQGRGLLEVIARDCERVLSEGPPDSILGHFVAAGGAGSCAATVDQLMEAGADRVVLVPNPAGYRSTPEMLEQMEIAAKLCDV